MSFMFIVTQKTGDSMCCFVGKEDVAHDFHLRSHAVHCGCNRSQDTGGKTHQFHPRNGHRDPARPLLDQRYRLNLKNHLVHPRIPQEELRLAEVELKIETWRPLTCAATRIFGKSVNSRQRNVRYIGAPTTQRIGTLRHQVNGRQSETKEKFILQFLQHKIDEL